MPPMTKTRRPKSADSTNTRPLRSSPLAGPALNPALTVASTDHSLMIATPPICHVLHPKSCQSLDSASTQPFSDSCPSSSATFRRRSYNPISAGVRSSTGRCQSLYLPSTSDSGRASWSTRTAAAAAAAIPEWEIDPLQSLTTSRSSKSQRSRSSLGISSFRLPIPIVEEEADWQVEINTIDPSASSSNTTSRNSSTSDFTHSRSASQTQDNSWYTVNPYDVTPRFSRLGLSSPAVVMPLSPKEHRRLSRSKSNSGSTNPPTKHFFIPSSTNSKTSPPLTPTRIWLQSRQSLSRNLSTTTTTSETSSIASQCETPAPVSSTSRSPPSLTRSRSSEDSISTSYESWPPTTPLLETDMALPGENDGEVTEFGGLDGHGDCDYGHYSGITIKKDSAGDVTRPNQHSMKMERTEPHPEPQPTLPNPPSPIFPKDIKKERDCKRKKLVRIKLQRVDDVDDLDGMQSSFTTLNMKTTTTTTTTMTAPIITAAEVASITVGLPKVQMPIPAVVSVQVVDSQHTILANSPLPTPTLKKKHSTFKSVLKSFIRRR